MRPSSWVLLCGAALGYGIYESSFASAAPAPLSYIRPLPAFLVLLVLLNRQKAAYVAAGLAGMTADLLAAGPPGYVFVRWLLAVCVIDALSETVVTNRSLFAAAILVTAARLSDGILILMGMVFFDWVLRMPWDAGSLTAWLGSYFFDLVAVTAMFVVLTMFTRRFLVTVNAARPTTYEP